MSKFQKASSIDLTDDNLELIPEAYLDEDEPTVEDIGEEVEKLVRESVAYL